MLKLASRNIFLNWRHSLATVLAIMAGFTSVALLDGFISAINEVSQDGTVNKGMTGHFLLEKRGAKDHLFEDPWLYSLSKEEQDKVSGWLEGDKRVKASMRYLTLSGLISNGKNSAIFIGAGIDEARGLKFRGDKWAWNTVAGKPFYLDNSGFQMGVGMATRMDCKFSEKYDLNKDGSYKAEERPLECANPVFQISATTEHAQVNALTLSPTGLVDLHIREYNDKIIYLPLTAAQQLLDTDRITRFSVLLNDEGTRNAFVRDYEEKIRASGLDLEVVHWLDHPVGSASKGGMAVLNMFRWLFLTIVAVVAVMSVANSLMKSINERIREIGTLRSYGFRRTDIVLLFSFEGLLLGFFACLLGIILSSALAFAISNGGMTFNAGVMSTPLAIKIDLALGVWAGSSFVLCLVTFLASWIVSRRAAKMTIADALRHIA
ncbi:MAG: ABC transporter permease [Bacteriovoracia bacterium]